MGSMYYVKNNFAIAQGTLDNTIIIYYALHSLKHRPGGSNSRNDPGMWLWYSDSTRRVANSGIRALWSWISAENWHFFSAVFFCLITGGARATFNGLNERWF